MLNNILTPAARIGRRFRQSRGARASTLTFALATLLRRAWRSACAAAKPNQAGNSPPIPRLTISQTAQRICCAMTIWS